MLSPRPSGSHQWGICSGSHGLQIKYPEVAGNTINTGAEEGTAAHEVCERILLSYINNTNHITPHSIVGTLASNGIAITQEMYEAASAYCTEILKHIKGENLSVKDLHVEESIALDHIYSGMAGTPDCWLFDPMTQTIYVWDFKFGFGIVEVFENPQLTIYLSGVLQKLPYNEHYNAVLTVFQPRAYHADGICRSWEFKASEIRGHINQLHVMAHNAMSETVSYVTGKHCGYCTGRKVCTALQQTVGNAVDIVTTDHGGELNGNDLAIEITLLRRIKELVKFRLTALEEQALHQLRNGTYMTALSAVPKRGRKRWKDNIDQDEVIMMGDTMGVDLRKPTSLDTPTQAINKFKSLGLDKDIIDEYSETPVSGFNLEFNDGSEIRKIFGRNK